MKESIKKYLDMHDTTPWEKEFKNVTVRRLYGSAQSIKSMGVNMPEEAAKRLYKITFYFDINTGEIVFQNVTAKQATLIEQHIYKEAAKM